jgi:hypothetical protein
MSAHVDSKRLTPIPPLTEAEQTMSQTSEETNEEPPLPRMFGHLGSPFSLNRMFNQRALLEALADDNRWDMRNAWALAEYIWGNREHLGQLCEKEIHFRGVGQINTENPENPELSPHFTFDFYFINADEQEILSVKTWLPEDGVYSDLRYGDDAILRNHWEHFIEQYARWEHGELGEFIVMTEEEALRMATEYIQENVGYFNAWYIAQFTNVDEDTIVAIQNADLTEPSRLIGALIGDSQDFARFVEEAIQADGINQFTYPDSDYDSFRIGEHNLYVFRI